MKKFKIPGKVILYTELPRYFKDLENGKVFVIFFGFSGNLGHWCAIWKDKDGYIHFFDRYGSLPDTQWGKVYNKYREKPPSKFLSMYLRGKLWGYNPFNVQRYLIERALKPENRELAESSCGALCILRLVLKDWPDKLFFELIKKMPTKDIYLITKKWILNGVK